LLHNESVFFKSVCGRHGFLWFCDFIVETVLKVLKFADSETFDSGG
jgi:hypothetical protein